MTIDIRREAARYYDLNGGPDDLIFYRDRITSLETKVFELGCGTGRLSIPLAESCAFVHGVDLSDAMISICMEKLEHAKLLSSKVKVELGDITQL
ncbi:MAG: class I SAM-dependent methyltransferase [bacterium]|nr:class I SAM-dependent methyltransferase [bacterium]